ncbi:hypothetical protein HX004_08750 [Myroides sp. 1354]|uniref:hypothetical protein n=1 Tax=unclassified Myroides TaxID=2642485 RepID=UPI00257744CC|nr:MULTISPECIES: hypothetical protein [unclassified Myroides]MDM1046011.1 hypothetical protein [Myroides sp. R163-1]MDM1055861.1 hypothetical protein [Myroides sp. 1354]MDM1070042.1 hypothetical protein [Myroides sp. 1372]
MDEKIYLCFSFLNTLVEYDVVSKIVNGDKQQEIRYTTEIKKVDGWLNTYYIIKRTPQIVFPVIDNPYIEALQLTSTLWKELHLSINNNGEIKKIVNLKEIQNYWITTLQFKLVQRYEGMRIQGLIAQLDQLVKSEQQLIRKIEQDSFFYHWIKHNLGEYIKNDDTDTYTKVGSSHCNYQIEQTKKGRTIQGRGKKNAAELEQLKEKWKLNVEKELNGEEHCHSVYNSDRELVSLVRNERYSQGNKMVRSTVFTITKK